VKHCLYKYFDDFVNFTCRAQASRPLEPAQVSLPHFNVEMPDVDMVDLSSSDTEEV
jgi:hypothetical protein